MSRLKTAVLAAAVALVLAHTWAHRPQTAAPGTTGAAGQQVRMTPLPAPTTGCLVAPAERSQPAPRLEQARLRKLRVARLALWCQQQTLAVPPLRPPLRS